MIRLTVSLLFLLGCAAPLSAQDAAVTRSAPESPAAATFTVAGTLPPAPAGELGIALPLLERIGREPSLATLEAGARDDHTLVQTLVARFTFSSLDALTAWYRSPGTRELLRQVEEALSRGTLQVSVSVERAAALQASRLPAPPATGMP